MHIVADFIELEIVAKDTVDATTFKVAFKILTSKATKQVLRKLKQQDYHLCVTILLSNIVYLDAIADKQGNLTNSFKTSIIKELLQSRPYFDTLLGNFIALLQSRQHIQVQALQEQNLFEVGKCQYELDYGTPISNAKKENDDLQAKLGHLMTFDDDPYFQQVTIVDDMPKLCWKSNVPFLEVFNIAKFYVNEWGILNPVVLIELAKEFELKCSDVLTFIPLLKAGYESMKPKDET